MKMGKCSRCGPKLERSPRGASLTPKETESRRYGVNVAVCLAEPEEKTLHQLQLRPKRLMGKATQQGPRVRRPLSARANWSLWPELTRTPLWRNTYTCMEPLWQESSIKSPKWSRRPLLCSRTVMEISQASVAVHCHHSHLQWQLGRAREKIGGFWSQVIPVRSVQPVRIHLLQFHIKSEKVNVFGKVRRQLLCFIHSLRQLLEVCCLKICLH